MSPFGLMSGTSMGGFGLMQDQDAAAKADALRMALLQAGLGIMSANTGGNLGAAIGQGGMQGLQAYQGAMQQNQQQKRQAAADAMQQEQFGMTKKRFKTEQAQTAEQAARRKAFEDAIRAAYQLDEQGNVIGVDQKKYQAALALSDPDTYAKLLSQERAANAGREGQIDRTTEGLIQYSGGKWVPLINPQTGKQWQPQGIQAYDPMLQGQIAGAKQGATTQAEAVANAQLGLPTAEANAAQAASLIDTLIAHPGRKAATGASSINPLNKIPGSEAYDFDVMSRQLKGKAFLESFQQLKGAGAITDREGAAATDAMARLDTAQSEKAYEQALLELKQIIQNGLERQRQKAGQAPALLTPNQSQGWGIRKIP